MVPTGIFGLMSDGFFLMQQQILVTKFTMSSYIPGQNSFSLITWFTLSGPSCLILLYNSSYINLCNFDGSINSMFFPLSLQIILYTFHVVLIFLRCCLNSEINEMMLKHLLLKTFLLSISGCLVTAKAYLLMIILFFNRWQYGFGYTSR